MAYKLYDNPHVKCFIVFNQKGFVRTTKNKKPLLKAGEHYVKLDIEVAKEVFQTPEVELKAMVQAAAISGKPTPDNTKMTLSGVDWDG